MKPLRDSIQLDITRTHGTRQEGCWLILQFPPQSRPHKLQFLSFTINL